MNSNTVHVLRAACTSCSSSQDVIWLWEERWWVIGGCRRPRAMRLLLVRIQDPPVVWIWIHAPLPALAMTTKAYLAATTVSIRVLIFFLRNRYGPDRCGVSPGWCAQATMKVDSFYYSIYCGSAGIARVLQLTECPSTWNLTLKTSSSSTATQRDSPPVLTKRKYITTDKQNVFYTACTLYVLQSTKCQSEQRISHRHHYFTIAISVLNSLPALPLCACVFYQPTTKKLIMYMQCEEYYCPVPYSALTHHKTYLSSRNSRPSPEQSDNQLSPLPTSFNAEFPEAIVLSYTLINLGTLYTVHVPQVLALLSCITIMIFLQHG